MTKIANSFQEIYDHIDKNPSFSLYYLANSLDNCICDSIERYSFSSMPPSIKRGQSMYIMNRFVNPEMRKVIRKLFMSNHLEKYKELIRHVEFLNDELSEKWQ